MLKLAVSTLAIGALLNAQSPCSPPSHFNGNFDANFYLTGGGTAPANTTGSFSYLFDMTCSAAITMNRFDAALYDYAAPGGNPNTAGLPFTFNIYEVTGGGSWNGNEVTRANWTLLGTGTAIMQSAAGTTPMIPTVPITFAAGMHGVMVEMQAVQGVPNNTTTPATPYAPVHPLANIIGAAPFTDSDQMVTVTNQGEQFDGFTLGVSRNWGGTNGWVHLTYSFDYTVASNVAYYSEYGLGCPNLAPSFAEAFTGPTPSCDLGNSTLNLINNGNSFIVAHTNGAPNWFTPVSTSLTTSPPAVPVGGSWDDAISAPIALPFTFPYPNGSTASIEIGSNGIVFLQPHNTTNDAGGYYDDTAGWLNKPANLAVAFGDQDATASPSYGIFFDVDPSGTSVYVTWVTQEWTGAAGPTQTFQVRMDSSGNVEYRYQGMNMLAAPILVGWTPGGGTFDPGQIDLSATNGFITGDGSNPTHLTANGRPVINTTFNFVTENIHAGTVFGALDLGFGALLPGIPLDALGAPGCHQYMATPGASVGFLTPTTAPVLIPLTIPNNVSLAGLQVQAEAVLLSPGVNQLGALLSNGLCITVNLN